MKEILFLIHSLEPVRPLSLQKLNRHYIAFDISKEYVEFGRSRVKSGPYLKEYKKKDSEPNVPKLSDFGQTDE